MKYLIILIMFLTGCESKENNNVIRQPGNENDLIRYQDPVYRVVCYRVRGFDGLQCFTINSLNK
jgi:hypothetical protein